MSAKASFVVGLQYGDEGKGKVVDLLAHQHTTVVRGNGGANAGHTILLQDGTKLALHQLPSGVAYEKTLNIIGHGVFLDPVKLIEELEEAVSKGVKVTPKQLSISTMCHLVFPIHKIRDAARESGTNSQGSTKAGIAYVASDKALREGLRAEIIYRLDEDELLETCLSQMKDVVDATEAKTLSKEFASAAVALKPFLADTVSLIHERMESGSQVLVEGAQAYGLDINHGKYPYTTSSDTTVPGLLTGTGINPRQVGGVVGVVKAIPSKVGGGAFVTKIDDNKIAESSRGMQGEVDAEYGATTGRQREVGYLDLVALKRAIVINGADEIALTKFDCMERHGEKTKIAVAYDFESADGKLTKVYSPPTSNEELERCTPVYETFETWGDISGLTDYEKLPDTAKNYIEFIEQYLGIPVSFIGTGPEREATIVRKTLSKVLR